MAPEDSDILDDHIATEVTKLLSRLLWAAYSVAVIVLGIAVGGAVWVTRTDVMLRLVADKVTGIEEFYIRDVNSRLHELEIAIAPGVLVEAKRELNEVQKRLRALEQSVRREQGH